jgi:predicted TIM-barrel fold metal-dependent hydrolase
MNGFIDIVCNLYTPKVVSEGRDGIDEEFKSKVRMPLEMLSGVTIENYLKKMDRAGIERSLLIAVRAGDLRVRGSFEVPYDYVQQVCHQYPDRFSGLAGIDPTRGMQGLRDLADVVRNHGFVGAHWYPHWFAMPPDAAQIYPYYAKCCELEIPIMMQVGQNLVYDKERRLQTVANPMCLDRVAIDFPELKLIGIHVGVPWTDEMIAMCWKHDNIYTAGDAYAPKYWPSQYVHYANSYGRHKVLFGTDWPVIDPERAVAEIAELELKPQSYQALMRDNALQIFKLRGHTPEQEVVEGSSKS